MAKIEVELPDNALRFLQAMQILWQHPQGWVQQYLTHAIIKAIETDVDDGLLMDKERLKELYGIERMGLNELPISKEVLTA